MRFLSLFPDVHSHLVEKHSHSFYAVEKGPIRNFQSKSGHVTDLRSYMKKQPQLGLMKTNISILELMIVIIPLLYMIKVRNMREHILKADVMIHEYLSRVE